jgi:hypothetical protein
MEMKSSTINLMLAAAALMAVSSAASAQTLKAEIPFAFDAAGHRMAAGTYYVNRATDERSFTMRNVQSQQSVVLLSLADVDPDKGWQKGDGKLQFACTDGCTLQQIWTGKSFPAHKVAGAKSERERPARLALIRLATSGAR